MSRTHPLAFWENRPVSYWRDAWRVPELTVFEEVGSTNDVARVRAEHGAPEGSTVLAEAQSAGRGRSGRRWHAPHGRGLLLSTVLRPFVGDGDGAAHAPGSIPLRIGLAVACAVEHVAGVPARLKWPNDVIVPDAGKVAGILCEGAVAGGLAFLVAGIGVNVNQRRTDFPLDVREIATSLRLVCGHEVSRADLAATIIEGVRHAAVAGADPLGPDELERLARRDTLRGHTVTVDGELRGTAIGIAPDGALLIRGRDGRRLSVRTGTVRAHVMESLGRRETTS